MLDGWLAVRVGLPVGPLFCVLTGPTRGRGWSQAAAREQLRHTATTAGVGRRFAPHQLRHAHAVEMAREGVPLIVIQRQAGSHLAAGCNRRAAAAIEGARLSCGASGQAVTSYRVIRRAPIRSGRTIQMTS